MPMPEAGKKRKKNRIVEIMPAYRERERKYVFTAPEEIACRGTDAVAAFRKRKLLALYEYVRANSDEFVTADHPALSPYLPPGVSGVFDMPAERTRPRQRLYFTDAGLKAQRLQVEFRQELDKSYGVKQTIKRGAGATASDPTLDRRELPAKLSGQGMNLAAVDGRDDRNWLAREFKAAALKPAFRMISQRLRTSYHPDGNQDVLIELACDVVLVGETVFGRVWQDPKLEIEIKQPQNLGRREAQAILDREEARLRRFGLERQLESNAVMGYEMLKPDLATPEGRRLFKRLRPGDKWWLPENRPGFGLS
jgi:hypothetical protein